MSVKDCRHYAFSLSLFFASVKGRHNIFNCSEKKCKRHRSALCICFHTRIQNRSLPFPPHTVHAQHTLCMTSRSLNFEASVSKLILKLWFACYVLSAFKACYTELWLLVLFFFVKVFKPAIMHCFCKSAGSGRLKCFLDTSQLRTWHQDGSKVGGELLKKASCQLNKELCLLQAFLGKLV